MDMPRAQLTPEHMQRLQQVTSMSAKERNSEAQAFRRLCNSKRGHDPELQAVFQAVQKLPGNKPISNMFEIYMVLGKGTDALKMKYTITAEKSHEVEKKNMDGMMTRGQMARHYNLPEDSPSIQAMIDKAVAVGTYQLHPRARRTQTLSYTTRCSRFPRLPRTS